MAAQRYEVHDELTLGDVATPPFTDLERDEVELGISRIHPIRLLRAVGAVGAVGFNEALYSPTQLEQLSHSAEPGYGTNGKAYSPFTGNSVHWPESTD